MAALEDIVAERPARTATRGQWLLWPFGIGLIAYLVSPVFFSQHLEGYTANLRSIALAWQQGQLASLDVITPVIIQYLFATRSGIIILLNAVGRLFGNPGDAGFRGLVIASFFLLAFSSVAIARRWSRLSLAAGVIGFVAIPGLVDIACFFNDNIIAAAIGLAAVALVSRSSSPAACAVSGGLLGAAVLCRTDALALCPVVAGVVWLRHGRLAPLLLRGAAAAAGLILVCAGGYAITGVTLIDALHIPAGFVPPRIGIAFRVQVFRLFLGVPALVLLCIGAALNFRQHVLGVRDIRWSLLFFVYPAAIAAVGMLRLSTEVRYIYPYLAPFCLIHVGRGLDYLAALISVRGWQRRAGLALAAGLLLVSVVPPDTFVRDGPHASVGRLWMPLLWFRWQQSVADSLRQIDGLVARAETDPQSLIVSTNFNDEYFFRLRLLDHGFQPTAAEDVFPECNGGFTAYTKPGHKALHLRTEHQYGLGGDMPTVVIRAAQIQRALQCPALWQFDEAFLAFAGDDVRVSLLPLDAILFSSVLPKLPRMTDLSTAFELRALLHPSVPVQETIAEQRTGELHMSDIHVMPLTKPELERIGASADQVMTDYNIDGAPQPFTYEDFKAFYRKRF